MDREVPSAMPQGLVSAPTGCAAVADDAVYRLRSRVRASPTHATASPAAASAAAAQPGVLVSAIARDLVALAD
jgi:hypothetical protein